MIINDLIILGRACPEPLKDGRVTVCLAGWSETHGFIRIYPTRYNSPCHQWDVIKLDVNPNERDTRLESRKIVGSKTEWETLADKVEVVGKVTSPDERRNLIGNLTNSCVNVINDAKRSLGIVKPAQILKTHFEDPSYGQLMQLGLPGMTELEAVKVKRNFPTRRISRIAAPKYRKTVGQQHDQQVLEWGFYESIRKNPDNKEQVWKNAGFRREGSRYLFVGRQSDGASNQLYGYQCIARAYW